MAEVKRYVDTDVSGGAGDGTSPANAYSSLNAAESALDDIDWVTAEDWLHIYVQASAGTADSTAVTFSTWTISADYYVLIEAGSTDRAAASGLDTDNYRLSVTDSNALGIAEDYIRVDGLQIEIIYSSASGKGCIYVAGQTSEANDIRISNCYLRGDMDAASNSSGIVSANVNTISKVWNCICTNFDDRGIWQDDCASMAIANCTIYNVTFRGIDQDSGTVDVENCAVFGTGDDFSGTFNLIDYCASDDNDGTNNVAESGGGAAWPSDFNGAATGDFTLLPGSALVGAGTNDPLSGLYSDDINGDSRSGTWDIGADEYVSGGSSIVPIIMQYMG